MAWSDFDVANLTNPINSLIKDIGEWGRRQRVYFWVLLIAFSTFFIPRYDCSNGVSNACAHLEWFYTRITGEK